MGCFSQGLRAREATQTLRGLIDEDIAQVARIFHEDGGGHVVNDGVEKTPVAHLIARFTPVNSSLGHVSLGHGNMRSKMTAGARQSLLLLTYAVCSKHRCTR
jgi:hypothetical protein